MLDVVQFFYGLFIKLNSSSSLTLSKFCQIPQYFRGIFLMLELIQFVYGLFIKLNSSSSLTLSKFIKFLNILEVYFNA